MGAIAGKLHNAAREEMPKLSEQLALCAPKTPGAATVQRRPERNHFCEGTLLACFTWWIWA